MSETPVNAGAISLYPFQRRGLDEGRAAYAKGARAVVFVGPTGMGKTTLASEAAIGRVLRGGRVVAIAHREELVTQMANRIAFAGRNIGLEVGAFGSNLSAPVQVTSIQTILARREMPEGDFVIVDEAHHYVSDEWMKPIVIYLQRGAKIMGLSATPERDDGRGLGVKEGGIFDVLVTVAQVRELVELNARIPSQGITPIEVWEPKVKAKKLALDPWRVYLDQCPGRHAVVFAPNIPTAEVMAEGFLSQHVRAGVVHGKLQKDQRADTLAKFARGDLQVLVNVNVLTEGWDAPICDVAMIARKVGSLSLLIQMIGRARRPHREGKVALLLDLSSNLSMHEFHPDDEIQYSLEGEAITRKGAKGPKGPRLCRVCKRVLDDDIAAAAAEGEELEKCPDCGTPLSKIYIPTAEEIELARVTRADQRKRAPLERREKALASIYLKGLHKGRSRYACEQEFKHIFSSFPDTHTRVKAWRVAKERFEATRGDAYEAPEVEA